MTWEITESLPEMGSDLSQFQWDTVSLRLTAFQRPDSEITVTDWWKSVVGEVPEQQTALPRSGEFTERGELGRGRLDLNINPDSMTWIHYLESLQIERGDHQEGKIVSFGAFPSASKEFSVLMSNWFGLEAVPNLVRLAFGAILFQSVQNQEEGYERLAKYIPAMNFCPAPSSSFSYQVNRRREALIDSEGLYINRVSKWSLAQHQIPIASPENEILGQTKSKSLIQLELDINTMREFEGEIQRSLLPVVFEELVAMGTEIARRGDVP